jgi:hypothetical protein
LNILPIVPYNNVCFSEKVTKRSSVLLPFLRIGH